MPFDGVTPTSKLQQLRDLIASVDDRDYDQNWCGLCAMGHAYKAGLLSFDPRVEFGDQADVYRKAAGEFGLPCDGAYFFGGNLFCQGGPRDRAEFLARVDEVLAKVTA